jgi:predicted ABC-type ATPase
LLVSNGSGKSTIKARIFELNPNWLGVYVNPDDIEREIAKSGQLDFGHFKVKSTKTAALGFLSNARQLIDNSPGPEIEKLHFRNNRLAFENVAVNSYFVSAIADLLHDSLIRSKTSFSFETVMSHLNKIDLLKRARAKGFRNYLYFVATEDPEINIDRVKIRVKEGGHDVPRNKIVSRYHRSLNNLLPAIRSTDRAYFFDNSGTEASLIAEVTNGKQIEITNSNVPVWFNKYVLERLT